MQRPDHPDFEKLAAIVRDMDHHADEGYDLQEIVKDIIDDDVLTYVATQRALRLTGTIEGVGMLMAAGWVDAFIAGVKYERQHWQELLAQTINVEEES